MALEGRDISAMRYAPEPAAAQALTCKVHPGTCSGDSRLTKCMVPAQSVLPVKAYQRAKTLVLTGGVAIIGVLLALVTGYVMASPTFGWTGESLHLGALILRIPLGPSFHLLSICFDPPPCSLPLILKGRISSCCFCSSCLPLQSADRAA